MTTAGAERTRRLTTAALWSIGVRIISAGATLIVTAVLARRLGSQEFGFLAAALTLIGILGVSDLGLGSGLTTEVAAAQGSQDAAYAQVVQRVGWRALLGVGGVMLLVGGAVALTSDASHLLGGADLERSTGRATLLVVVVALALGVPAGLGARVQLGLQRGDLVARWALAATLTSAVAVAAVASLTSDLVALAAATAVVPVAVLMVQSLRVIRAVPALTPGSERRSTLRRLVGTGGLFLVLDLSSVLSYETDVIVVVNVIGPAAAAVLALHTRVFSFVSGITSAAIGQVWPATTEALASGDLAWVRRSYLRLLRIIVLGAGSVTLVLALAAHQLVRLWVGPHFHGSDLLILGLALWTVYGAVMSLSSLVLTSARIVRPQVIMASVMTAANIPTSIWLAHTVGVAGPVLATLVCHAVVAGVPTVVLVRRLLVAP